MINEPNLYHIPDEYAESAGTPRTFHEKSYIIAMSGKNIS